MLVNYLTAYSWSLANTVVMWASSVAQSGRRNIGWSHGLPRSCSNACDRENPPLGLPWPSGDACPLGILILTSM